MTDTTRNCNTTRDGIEVARDQLWVSLDKRRPSRTCRVTRVCGGVVTMQEESRDRDSAGMQELIRTQNPVAKTWKPEPVTVAVRRMHKHSTGWALVEGQAAGAAAA